MIKRHILIAFLVAFITFNSFSTVVFAVAQEPVITFELTYEQKNFLESIENKQFKLGITNELFYNSQNKTGMIIPLLDFLKNKWNVNITPINVESDAAIKMLQDKTLDIAETFIENESDKNLEVVSFYSTQPCIISRRGDPLVSLFNLKDKRIGMLKNSTYSEYLHPYLSLNNLINFYASPTHLLNALNTNMIDVVVSSGTQAQLELIDFKNLNVEFYVDNTPINQNLVAINSDASMLLSILSEFLKTIDGQTLTNDVGVARSEILLQKSKEKYADEIKSIQNSYGRINAFDQGSLHPLGFIENDEFKGVQREIYDIFEILTDRKVKILATNSFENGLHSAYEQLINGEIQVVSGDYINPAFYKNNIYEYSSSVWTSDVRMYTFKKQENDIRSIGTTYNLSSYLDWSALFGIEPTLFNSRAAMLNALENGEIDAVVVSEMTYDYYLNVLKNYNLRGIGNVYAPGNISLLYSSKNVELNTIMNQAINLYQMLYPEKRLQWINEALQFKYKYSDMQTAQLKTNRIINLSFCGMLIIFIIFSLFLANSRQRFKQYDDQVSTLIRTQQNFDLIWGNIKTKKLVSKGQFPFFRKWGFKLPDNATYHDLNKALGMDVVRSYTDAMAQLSPGEYTTTKNILVAPIDNQNKHYVRYLHQINQDEFMLCLQDITQEVEREEHLKTKAITDTLTALKNRGAMDELLESKLLSNSSEKSFLMMIDIDNFKSINDSYGHDVGDKAIIELANMLNNIPSTIASRWGGEEFLVLAEDFTYETIENLGKSLCSSVSGITISLSRKSISFTVSIGIAILNKNLDKAESIRAADQALYHAKESGKNRAVISTSFDNTNI